MNILTNLMKRRASLSFSSITSMMVNLLPIKDLRALYEKISSDAGLKSTNAREKAVFVSSELASSARKLNIDLTLRK